MAQEALGKERKARSIYDENKKVLKIPTELPAGIELKLPQAEWPAWIVFGGLCAFLLVVGMGLALSASPEKEAEPANGDRID